MTDVRSWRWCPERAGLAFGGDYNPDQWDRAVWFEDVELMRAAGVRLVNLGIFAWSALQPAEDRFTFGWLDEAMDLLDAHDIAVDLATATATPPPWLSRRYPDSRPVNVDGIRLDQGSRQVYCISSPDYRRLGLALVEQVASRYAHHPALAMWHVDNELGMSNAYCYCDTSAAAFRRWLTERYETLDALNDAWGTSFWGQRYGDWAEITPPRRSVVGFNPSQQLDFARFSTDELRSWYVAQREVLRRHAPDVPATTNFMMADFTKVDYGVLGPEVDLVSNDHYVLGVDPDGAANLALSADMTRGVAGGQPWLLMEQSTSGVNWYEHNAAFEPGKLRRHSLQHVARGADGILFFQWRQSVVGAEKWHSAMVPHAGADTRIFSEVCRLGADLAKLAEVAGTTVRADVALLWDWPAQWASQYDGRPSAAADPLAITRQWHHPFFDRGITVDVVRSDADLGGYRLVVVPGLYLVDDAAAAALARYVESGGTAVVTWWSGVVDEHDHVRTGGYPGAFRELLGAHAEEAYPLPPGTTAELDDGTTVQGWTEWVQAHGAEVVASYADGVPVGRPAVTRRRVGTGQAWYVSAGLTPEGADRVVGELLAAAGLPARGVSPRAGVETVVRRGADASYLFVINHSDSPVTLSVRGYDLLGDRAWDGEGTVVGEDVAVVRLAREVA